MFSGELALPVLDCMCVFFQGNTQLLIKDVRYQSNEHVKQKDLPGIYVLSASLTPLDQQCTILVPCADH